MRAQGFALIFDSRAEMSRWALTLDSLRTSQSGVQTLLDIATRSSLLQSGWQESFSGGQMLARLRGGHMEEW